EVALIELTARRGVGPEQLAFEQRPHRRRHRRSDGKGDSLRPERPWQTQNGEQSGKQKGTAHRKPSGSGKRRLAHKPVSAAGGRSLLAGSAPSCRCASQDSRKVRVPLPTVHSGKGADKEKMLGVKLDGSPVRRATFPRKRWATDCVHRLRARMRTDQNGE